MSHYAGPWLTAALHAAMRARLDSGAAVFEGSFDLGRTHESVSLDAEGWTWRDQRQPWPERIKERTVYVRDGDTFAPLQRFAGKLIKLVPTEWGAPTFEIDGIKMLVSAQLSPIDDARRKVALIEPQADLVKNTVPVRVRIVPDYGAALHSDNTRAYVFVMYYHVRAMPPCAASAGSG